MVHNDEGYHTATATPGCATGENVAKIFCKQVIQCATCRQRLLLLYFRKNGVRKSGEEFDNCGIEAETKNCHYFLYFQIGLFST